MILPEIICSKSQRWLKILLIFVLCFILIGCNENTGQSIFDAREIQVIEGEWYVSSFLGEAIEYHGAQDKIEEQIGLENEINAQTKKMYLEKRIIVSTQTVIAYFPPTEIGYSYPDWEALFFLFRQPAELDTAISPPFVCIEVLHKAYEDSLYFIVGSDDSAILYIKGLFFSLKREEQPHYPRS